MHETQLTTISSAAIDGESHTLDRGAIIYSHRGIASVRINFDHWDMQGESVLIMFPGDVIQWEMMDDDFSADALIYCVRRASTSSTRSTIRSGPTAGVATPSSSPMS